MKTQVVYHGTDIKAVNRIRKERIIRGDPNALFGVGFCGTVSRARSFVCIKCVSRTRRVGRVIRMVVAASLVKHNTPEAVQDAFTVNNGPYLSLRALSLDDPRVLSFEVLTIKQQEKLLRAEYEQGRA